MDLTFSLHRMIYTLIHQTGKSMSVNQSVVEQLSGSVSIEAVLSVPFISPAIQNHMKGFKENSEKLTDKQHALNPGSDNV